MPLLDATIKTPPVDPRFALIAPVDESGRTEAMSEIPDIQHQAYKYGVIGKTVEAAGKLAADVHEGYQVGKHGAGVSSILDPIQEDLLKISSLEQDVNGLQRQRRMAATREEVSRIEPELVNKLDALRKAQEQGSISSKDAILRVKALTRNAVNNNPGYASRIVNYTGDLLWASGIREIKDPYAAIDAANRQAAKDRRDHISSQAKLYKVAYHPDDLLTEEGQQRIIAAYTQRAAAKNAADDVLTDTKVRSAVDLSTKGKREDHAITLKDGYRFHIEDLINTTYNALSSATNQTERDQIMLQYNSAIENNEATIRKDFNDKRYSVEETNRHINDLKDYIKVQEKILQSYKKGETSAKQKDTAVSLQKVVDGALDVYGYNKTNRKLFSGMSPQTLSALAKDNPNLAKHAEEYVKIEQGLIDPSVRRFLTEKIAEFDNEPAMVHYVKTLIESGDIANTAEVLKNVSKVYNVNSSQLKTQDKVIMRDGVIEPLSKLSTEASGMLSSDVKEGLSKMLSDQTNDVVSYILPYRDAVNLQGSITPNGDVVLNPIDLKTGEINKRVDDDIKSGLIQRLNEVIRANAAIQGTSRTESASQVLAQHADTLGISLPQQEQTTKPKEQDMLTKEFIKSKEGFREKAYQDEGGKWTIGYGFTSIDGVPVKEGDTITKEDAEFQMDRILAQHQSFKSKITRPLTPYQEDALSSFEFNLGSGVWNQPRGKKIIEAINDGDFNTAAELWRTYTKVKDPKTGQYVNSQGLINRRNDETALFTKPVQVATGD